MTRVCQCVKANAYNICVYPLTNNMSSIVFRSCGYPPSCLHFPVHLDSPQILHTLLHFLRLSATQKLQVQIFVPINIYRNILNIYPYLLHTTDNTDIEEKSIKRSIVMTSILILRLLSSYSINVIKDELIGNSKY